MEGQGRRWKMWKIRRRQERAKAWMAREGSGNVWCLIESPLVR